MQLLLSITLLNYFRTLLLHSITDLSSFRTKCLENFEGELFFFFKNAGFSRRKRKEFVYVVLSLV